MLTLSFTAFKLTIPVVALILLILCYCSAKNLPNMPAVINALTNWRAGAATVYTQRPSTQQ